ncbi:hypothetical protein JAB5_01470 [Janthinobacterium sp. HH103]|uniref:hypothetical protein n=1 Tax=unclassified Janthinobacterium TaxID=2610881 RepID=UPI0008759278|nr:MULTISPECIES: hypothetical protein [unclassified Janthinobacterium]OEZ73176.1 hypothetical protein JAB2_01040 [Janthinobacterium sp. HH100]OEZ73219.1 hypothetical protein JAB2_01470 [Janthinobacterium sp. HH100]OEZ85642.1 hypothetical protein JAB8_38240 [Janthinobacterium sp. HH106]OEZ88895.1 hypothetical protein JAB5_01470 [Janthinobacterium sp. HH103]QOU75428.1 hypothetical protein JAB4_049120 [Janthinobacterium sp. HH102]
MSIVVALTIIFSDGYMGGSVHARDFKTMAECKKFAPQLVRYYTGNGHPASFVCERAEKMERRGPPETHSVQTLPAG